MKTLVTAILAMLLLIGTGSVYAAEKQAPQPSTGLSSTDQTFVDKAAKGGIYGLELGKVAMEKAQTPAVKAFAENMVKENQTMNTELESIAQRKGISSVRPLEKDQRQGLDKLSKMSGKDFDTEFMKTALEEHQNTLAAFQQEAKSGQDKDLQHFAANTVPVLQNHIQLGKKAQGAIKK